MTINILAVGDICGESGLDFLRKKLNSVKRHYDVSFTVVNGENASVTGLTPQQADSMLFAGADVITLGNHTFGRSQIISYLDEKSDILRPENIAPQNPGRGYGIFSTPFGDICVINLIGRCGMLFGPDNPFFAADRIIDSVDCKIKLLDFHAEATSEKAAMAYYTDGRLSAVWGTHTHVQTSDGRVFPKGTGFITDLGMTGPEDSVIGVKAEQSVSMFLGNPPQRYEAPKGASKMECALFEIDTETGKCINVESLRIT